MHSKFPVVNAAEPPSNAFGKKCVAVCNSQLLLIFKKAVPIHLLIIHFCISLQLFSKYKWLYHFIITQVTFRHFLNAAIANELLQVCYNCSYPIQCTKFIAVTDLGFTMLLTSQAISVAFYNEREKSNIFCARLQFRFEVLLHAVNLRHGTNGFTSLPKEGMLRIFTLWKNPSTQAELEPANTGSSGEYDNHGTTGPTRNW